MIPTQTLLAIETSCDETGISVLRQEEQQITVLAQAVASQVDIHKATGGVVPEVAAREHVTVFRPLLEKVMSEAGVKGLDLDAIAVTIGPGLQPALAVGVNAVRTLAYAWQKPLVPVQHLEGHVYSALLAGNHEGIPQTVRIPEKSDIFPALALIVSGGHTLLVKIADHLDYEILGTTQDDAVGEAFDKVARLLGLPYPGGPELSRLAEQGDPGRYTFPRPMLKSGDLQFSFSGLKTAVLYTIRDLEKKDSLALAKERAHLAASFERAAVETLVGKFAAAIKQVRPKVCLLAGGVAANTRLREALQKVTSEQLVPLKIAPLALCGDNAVMIGYAGLFAYAAGRTTTWPAIDALARFDLLPRVES